MTSLFAHRRHSKIFREWTAGLIGPDGLAINPSSSQQLQTFLFGGSTNVKTKEPIERCRTFKVLREEVRMTKNSYSIRHAI